MVYSAKCLYFRVCMSEKDFNFEDDGRYYAELAAAFVRGKLGITGDLSSEELIGLGRERGLRLHKFKRQAELPRVRRVLGILQGLAPAGLLDIGSGRGAFLWPLLDSFPAYGGDRAGSQSGACGGY